MPVWHDQTRESREAGKLELLGIIQEQHPERCRLFLQWKRMRFPILVDSLDLLGVSAVPLTFLVDEHGVIRSLRPSPADLERFLQSSFEKPAGLPVPAPLPDPVERGARARAAGAGPEAAGAWLDHGDALFLRDGPQDLGDAVEAYRRAVASGGPPEGHFRLGVALRKRAEGARRQPGDFQAAVDAWARALALRPEQYIWRRRIQQYGPRLEKPYAFYDWVEEARREIAARGEAPVKLEVEPGGAEIAGPWRAIPRDRKEAAEPDPRGRIPRDTERLVTIELTAAPRTVAQGRSARLHLRLSLDSSRDVHWNNEGEELRVWLDPPPGFEAETRLLSHPLPRTPSSTEIRSLDLEVRAGEEAPRGRAVFSGYALFGTCEGKRGTCRYLRQEFQAEMEVVGKE